MAKAQIVLPKVVSFFQDKEAGRRVDEVLTKLTAELQNLKAADTSAVAGQDAATVGSSGIFFQTFENPVTTWTKRTDSGTVSYPSNGQAGGKAFRSAGGESFYEFPEGIPFNPDRLYRIRAKVRMVTAPTDPAKDLIYVGVQAFEADGSLIDTSGGTTPTLAHWYAVAAEDMGARTLGTWYTFTGYFQGWGTPSTTPSTDADAPRTIHSNARYIRPCFRLNAIGGNGVMEIDYISLEVLTEGTESNQTMKDVVNLSTGIVANNKVEASSINVTNLSAINADLGTVTAGYIRNSGNTAAIRLSGSTTLPSTNYLDFTATGTSPFLKHSALTLEASGNATFSGTVSGNTFSGTNAVFAGSIKNQGGAGSYVSLTTAVNVFNLVSGDDVVFGLGGTKAQIVVNSNSVIDMGASSIGFLGTSAVAKQTVTGSRGGNAALASLLTALANFGLITDSTT